MLNTMGADAQRARHQRPLLDDDPDKRLAHRHLEGVGDADKRGDGEVDGDISHTGRRHHRQRRRAGRQEQVDADQKLQAWQAVGREAAHGSQQQIEDVEQEARDAEQEDRLRHAEHQPGQRHLLDPGADDRHGVARGIDPEARLGERRGQPQVPVGHPCLP
jgi:hypothetical protein